eukprot:8505176-Pyramimonas_sp.AAC.3
MGVARDVVLHCVLFRFGFQTTMARPRPPRSLQVARLPKTAVSPKGQKYSFQTLYGVIVASSRFRSSSLSRCHARPARRRRHR